MQPYLTKYVLVSRNDKGANQFRWTYRDGRLAETYAKQVASFGYKYSMELIKYHRNTVDGDWRKVSVKKIV